MLYREEIPHNRTCTHTCTAESRFLQFWYGMNKHPHAVTARWRQARHRSTERKHARRHRGRPARNWFLGLASESAYAASAGSYLSPKQRACWSCAASPLRRPAQRARRLRATPVTVFSCCCTRGVLTAKCTKARAPNIPMNHRH